MSRGRRWLWVPDRMAVLVVGLIAGFAVGLSFRAAPAVAPPLVLTAVPPDGAAAPVQASAPDQIVAPQVVRRVAAGGGTIRIGVFGDSFGIGVWDSLYRALPGGQGFQVLRFGKEATGFAHYNTLDLVD